MYRFFIQTNGDNDDRYVQMFFLAQGIEKWTARVIETTLGRDAWRNICQMSGLFDDDEIDTISNSCPISSLYGVLIDQSFCDHQPSLREVSALINRFQEDVCVR
eukprot:GHVP01000024.1.p2 GENE.GHVP01000024.1~~GHVP01000024.1.p2  ORF type:complete len:104 (-),score=7.84 GHVP01000024.1:296-607(-)